MPGLTPNKQLFMHIYSSRSLFFVFVPVIILFKSNMDAITTSLGTLVFSLENLDKSFSQKAIL